MLSDCLPNHYNNAVLNGVLRFTRVLRKYPSNLIRITPAKGFEALSKSFATHL